MPTMTVSMRGGNRIQAMCGLPTLSGISEDITVEAFLIRNKVRIHTGNFLYQGIDAENLPPSSFVFTSKKREYLYPVGGKTIPFVDIRSHFNLKSAYFSVDIVSNNLVRLRGKGYGHGVGMCQDGAMQMARRGKSYKEILSHYFKGVSVIDFSQLDETIEVESDDFEE